MDIVLVIVIGVVGSVIAAVGYDFVRWLFKHSPKKALANISLWKNDGDCFYYSKNPDYRISVKYDDEIFSFYDNTRHGKELKNFDMLKADIGIKKEIWDFCNKGLPITDNSYQVASAKFCSTSSDSFTVKLVRVALKHYPVVGYYNNFFIPESIWRYKSKKELIGTKDYQICRILYLNSNEGKGSNDTYLDFIDWN